MFSRLSTPAIIAHRGASAYAPENTLAAFNMAVDLGADAIELDAKLSGDGEVVVIHDQTVDRTTGVAGRVGELPLKALQELDAAHYMGGPHQGEKIPALAEVFEALGAKIFINVELTNYASPTDALAEKAAELVKIHSLQERVLFSSFHPLNLIRVRRHLPGAALGLLTLPGKPGRLLRSPAGRIIPHQALHPEKDDVTRALVERTHRSGRHLNVWTVNQAEDMRRFLAWKVDGIITDDPRLARQILGELKAEAL